MSAVGDPAVGWIAPISAATRRHLARLPVDPGAVAHAVVEAPGIIGFAAGDAGFRLYPGVTGARLAIRRFVAGPRRFETGLRSSDGAPAVRFRVTMTALDSARVVDQAETVLESGDSRTWRFDLNFFFGDALIDLAAECLDSADTTIWAEFLSPSLN